MQALFGQLLIGLINGAFYAVLSLGLAIIFGLLNIINFTHGAQYMLGAFCAWLLLQYVHIGDWHPGYWSSLIIAPIVVGAFGMLIERTMLSRLYKLDHLYGLLLTFGLALVIQGVFRNEFGSSGLPYQIPSALTGGVNLGFMYLPIYRAWVIVASLVVCFVTWYVIERTKLGSYLRAATENPTLVQAFGINVPLMITLTFGARRRPRRVRRRHGRTDLPGQSADGGGPDHRRVRGRRHRRHGLDHGRDPDRFRPGCRRGTHQVFLCRGVDDGHLRHHGDRVDDQAGGLVRTGALTLATGLSVAAAGAGPRGRILLATAVMAAVLAVAPLVDIYPVIVEKAMCFALFACAFNLLLGFGGLLSFGHAMFLGTAGYVCAYTAKRWGLPPELAILLGTATSAALGVVVGALAIRRQGIYFAMVTLAIAQMMYFVYVQAPFTHGEDGIQSVPRGRLFGLIDLSHSLAMYYTVLVVFIAAFLLIYRIVHSPFGQVLKAIRENEPRAISLGYDADRYKLLAFVLSATLAGLAGALKAIVFQLASLTDVHWSMSGEVVLMTLLGGMGTIFGPVVGAFIIVALENYLAGFGEWVTVITGAIFVVCVLAFRRGVVGELGAWWKGRQG